MENPLKYNIELTDKPISAAEIARCIADQQTNYTQGAYNIFLGQVRADVKDGNTVTLIEYTAFKEMATAELEKTCNEALARFNISHISIVHSLGQVKKGEICLLVLVAGGHRTDIFSSCQWVVENIKKNVPIWGKEILVDNTHLWKINK